MNGADLEIKHRKGCGKQYGADGKIKAVRIGIKQLFKLGKHPAHYRAENKRAKDFKQGIYKYGDHIQRTAGQSFGNTEGYGEYDKTHRIIKGNYGKQQFCQGSVSFILTNDHKGGGRGGSGGYGAEGYGLHYGKFIWYGKMDQQQHPIHYKGGGKGLNRSYYKSLSAGFFKLVKSELVADGKGYKSKGHLGNKRKGGNILKGGKAYSVYAQSAETIGSHKNARYKIGRNRRKLELFKKPRHYKSGKKSKGNRQ